MKSVTKMQRRYVQQFIASCLLGALFVAMLFLNPIQSSTAQSCSFTISQNSQNFAYGGGSGSIGVTASSASCNWSSVSNAPWISITSGASGMGNGVVVYLVTSNLAASMRSGTITVAGQTFIVTQDAGQNGLMFYPLPTPIRLLDTRSGAMVGCDTPGTPIMGNTSRTQTAAGRTCSGVPIPATARALTGHVTTVQSEGGFLTLYPSDAMRPLVANTNYQASQIVNNVFTVGLGAADGAFNIYAFKTTDVVIDVTGYYAPPGAGGLYFHPLPKPIRLLETRQGQMGCDTPGTQLGTGSTRTQATAGRICDAVTIPANAMAVTGNATVVAPSVNGFLTLFPSNAAQPFVASSNYPAGQTVNGPFTVGLGPDGAFKIFVVAMTDLVIDLQGYFSTDAVDVNGTGLLFSPLPTPVRLLETRPANPGCFTPTVPLNGNTEYTQPATGICQGVNIPATARAVVGNATTVLPLAQGFLTFWPSNVARPLIATSNYKASVVWNRHFTVGLGIDGAFNIYALSTTDLVVDLSGFFAPPANNQAPLADAGPDKITSAPSNTATLTAAASDDGLPSNSLTVSWSKVSGPGTVNFSAPNSVTTNATFSQQGSYVLRLTASDSQLAATDDVAVTVNPPLAINAGMDQVITLPNTAMMLGTTTGGAGTITLAWSKVIGPGSVLFSNASGLGTTAIFGISGTYVLRLTAMDSMATVSDDVQVIVNADPTTPPPDPMMVAPPLNMTVATTIGVATEFLYSGANPIQTGVAPGTINKVRVGVLKGRVLDKTNQPLSLVRITILDHPEFGQTLSRVDGRFDMAVNGGGKLTVNYEKLGYLPVQRTEDVPWQHYEGVPDVVMMGYDANVTLIDLLANAPIQVAQSTVSTDSSGARRTTFFFKQGTAATMTLPGGAMVGLDKLHVRATEFTVGANGPNAMPGDLPPTSAYTYAAAYTIDEAVAANAIETTFSQPVIQYNENFLNLPVGTNVPSGSYDKQQGIWMPSANGRIVKILSVTSGQANLDVNGNGVPATDPEYAALGIDSAERQQLATSFTINQSLWRVPVIHFSSWDFNFGFGPPAGSGPPNGGSASGGSSGPAGSSGSSGPSGPSGGSGPGDGPGSGSGSGGPNGGGSSGGGPGGGGPSGGGQGGGSGGGPAGGGQSGGSGGGNPVGDPTSSMDKLYDWYLKNGDYGAGPWADSNGTIEIPGCILGMEDQRLSEELNITGTKFFLRYDSTRPHGNVSNYTATIPLSGVTLPGPIKRIELTVSIAGQTQVSTFPAQTNQITSFTWNGKDTYGRDVQGQQELLIDIGNVYDGTYQNVANFGYNGNGVPITTNTRQEIIIHRIQRVQLGSFTAPPQVLGGWSLSEHHVYDPVGQKLYEGNGKQRNAQTVSNVINTFAGGLSGFLGDGGPLGSARFKWPSGLGFAPDGSIYVADSGNSRIRKIAPNGTVTTFAGNGNGCNPSNFPCGDGGPALNAEFGGVIRVAVARDGSVYIGGGRNLWRVTTDGIFHRVTGLATSGFSGDGGSALNAQISDATRFALAADGSVYLSDMLNQRIRRIDPNGIITTIAGTGTAGFSGDGGLALNAQLNFPGDIVAAPDGSVYFIDQDNNRIRRIATDGTISTYAGTGVFGVSPDGLPALQTNFVFRASNQIEASSMALAPDGSLYVVSYANVNGGRIRRIGPDGIVTGIAGNGQVAARPNEGDPALAGSMRLLALGLAPDGSIYQVGGFTFDFDESRIWKISSPLPGFTNSQIAIPSDDGRQLFRFDAQGRHLNTVNTLTGATVYTFAYDSAGRLTTITDGDNNVTTIQRNGSGQPTGILSPYNQLTTFALNAGGYLATMTNPAGEQYQFTYNASGQMLTETDPRDNQNTYTYDASGRLIRDDDPATGFQTLTRTGQDFDFTVARNTALNRQSSFRVQTLGTLDRNRIVTFPDNTQDMLLERASGMNTLTVPDGTITNTQIGGDPRWKLQTPLTASTNIATPSALNYNRTFVRAASLSNPADPLSLVTQNDTTTINSRIYTDNYTAATGTFALTTPVGRVTTTTTDTQGRTTARQFATLNPAAYSYDTRGRLATGAFGSGMDARSFTMVYNAGGFLASLTDALNRVTSFIYDSAGRVTQQTTPDSRNVGFGYDAKGNLTSLVPPGRPAHGFTYTAVDLLASYVAPGNVTTMFSYNLDRELTGITRPDALQLDFAYDSAGRLQTLTAPNGNYTYVYNGTTGKLASITAPGGGAIAYLYDGFLLTRQTWTGAVAGNVAQTFDNDFRLASQSVNNANTVNFTYDNDSLLTGVGALTLTRNAQTGFISSTALNNVTDTRAYNGFAELTGYNAKFNAATLYDLQFSYDKLGRVTQKIEMIGGVMTTNDYGYDLAGRLQTVTRNGVLVDTYSYDSNDNRASLNRSGVVTNGTYDSQDRLMQYGAATYGYTANGELQSKTVGVQTTNYGYDVLGNLRTVTLPDNTQIAYEIDGQNRRIGKRVNGTLVQGFLYQNQLEPVAELDGANNLVSRFVYGSRSHVPDYMVKGGVTYRLIVDQVGSVRLVVDVATGAIAQRMDYDEFGVVTMDTAPGFQPFGFAGGLYDKQTKLTRFGARDYDAETGRWTAKDPILFQGGDTNLYGYVSNNPLNLLDPSGFAPTGGSHNGGGFTTGAAYFNALNQGTFRQVGRTLNSVAGYAGSQ